MGCRFEKLTNFRVARRPVKLRFSEKFCVEPTWQLMSVCYPKTPVGGVGVGQHTDLGFLTILNQDMIGGLEVKVDEDWINVLPEKGTLVINIGDMMENFTNKAVSFGYI